MTSGKPDRLADEDEDVNRCLRFPRFHDLTVGFCGAREFPAFVA